MALIPPVFQSFKAEGEIIGGLIVAYGELEIALCRCVAEAVNNLDMVVKPLFGKRLGEAPRINKAVSIGLPAYRALGLDELCSEIICEMHHCREIRNQFAHCVFYEDPHRQGHLLFSNVEERASQSEHIVELTSASVPAKRIAVELLKEQETHFTYVWGRLIALENKARVRAGKLKEETYTVEKMNTPERHLQR